MRRRRFYRALCHKLCGSARNYAHIFLEYSHNNWYSKRGQTIRGSAPIGSLVKLTIQVFGIET